MNRDINNTLMALVPILRMNGEKVKSIEAVRDWYKVGGREYMKEVAEIVYDNGHCQYADIGCDSNLTAIYDGDFLCCLSGSGCWDFHFCN